MSIDLAASVEAEQMRKTHPFREVAVTFLENETGRFLFSRSRKLPNSWTLIGGGKEPGDVSLVDTAVREIREETGLALSVEALTFILEAPYDFGEGKVRFFRATLPQGAELKFDTQEILETRWITLQEALELPMFPATKTCVEFY